MASDLKLQLRLEMQTAQGESALKRFDAALDAALKKMGAGGREVGLIKQLAAEVEASKKKLSELPPHYRKLVEQINQANRGAKLLDEVGITRTHAQIRAEIERVRQSFAALKQSGMLTYPELAQAAERTRAAIRGLGEQMIGARTQGERMLESISRIGTVMNLMAGALAGNQIVRVADDMQRLIGRLAVVEGSAAGARARLADLAAIASRSGADVEATASGYAKMATSIRNAGGSTQQALDMTEALALALKVSGADATQTSATMMQLAQALQKGVLNGDEFTSVAENGGKVLDYLAFALGKTRGQLRQMAADGALTTAELLKLTTQLDRIRKDAENIPATVGDAFQRLTNSAKLWVADSERVGVATRALIAVIDFAAEHFGKLVDLLMLAGVGVIVARIGSIVAAMRVLAASLGIIAGLSPVGRVVMGLVTAFTLLVDPVQRAWQALTSRGADASARLGEVGNALESIKTIATQAGDAIRQALDAETKKAAETVKQLSASYKQVADDIKAIWDARVAEIESNYQREVAAAQNAAHSESAAIRESVQSLLAAEREKLAAVEAGARQM
ncbi:MAG: tape measure protein, partial [Thermoflexales bacterium]